MARVYLKGLPQLKAKLQKLANIAEPSMRKVMEDAARIVVAEIKSRAKWDRVRDSVAYTFGEPPRWAQMKTTVARGGLQVTIFVGGKGQRISHWLEHGTRPHFNKGQFEGTIHPGTPAQPFFFPGWRAKRNQVRKMLRDEIKKAVRGVAKS